jgi:hypothetical protein
MSRKTIESFNHPLFPALRFGLGRHRAAEILPKAISGAGRQKRFRSNPRPTLIAAIALMAGLLMPLAAQDGVKWTAHWVAARDVPMNPPKGQQYIPAANPPGAFSTAATGLGYHAEIAASAETLKWVQVDLGRVAPLEKVRLRPLNHVSVPGFAFPLRYRVEVADDAAFKNPTLLVDRTAADVPNPGTTVIEIEGRGHSARYVRVTATRLPARATIPSEFLFGLRSLEVISGGKNVALDAPVAALDSVEAYGWGKTNLTAAFVPATPPRLEAVMMRHEIVLVAKPARAVARVAGMGLVDFMINGRKAGDRVLAPALSDFTKRAYFDTYDVTALLHDGTNTLAALLGNGHFAAPGRGWGSWFGVGNEPVALQRFLERGNPGSAAGPSRLEQIGI